MRNSLLLSLLGDGSWWPAAETALGLKAGYFSGLFSQHFKGL